MAFKFRLETSLRLASQEKDVAQGELAGALRQLQLLTDKRDEQAKSLLKAIASQKEACLREPSVLGQWQRFCEDKKRILKEIEYQVGEQKKIVEQYREKLIECRIKVEKFKRLKAKNLKLYQIEELRTEQKIIDEIAQKSVSEQ